MAIMADYDPIEIDDYTMDADDGPFTEQERHENYQYIVGTIQSIQACKRITEDWMEEHKRAILRWRSWIPNFSEVNEEREDEEFRKLCVRTETLMQYVVGQIREKGHFEVIFYLHLLQCMQKMIELLHDEDELSDMLKSMGME